MKINFDEKTHTYRVDGKITPSVTQILEILFGSYDGNPIFGEIGDEVHACIVDYINSDLDEDSIDDINHRIPVFGTMVERNVKGLFFGAKKFIGENKDLLKEWKDLTLESIVNYNEDGFYSCGTVDLIGDELILDWKTGSPKNKAHTLQLMIYAVATFGYQLSRDSTVNLYNVYLKSDCTYEKVERFWDEELFMDFNAALRLWHRYFKRRKK